MRNWYKENIFPLIMGQVMDNKVINEIRKKHLKQAEGICLEIGIGEGKSLKYYGADVKVLYAIEPNRGMHKQCKVEGVNEGIELILTEGKDKKLPYNDEMFDTVIMQFVMCSIVELKEMLVEIKRVLKKNGKLIFIEHGRSSYRIEAKLQDSINPLYNMLGAGCNVNRDYIEALKEIHFREISVKRYKSKGMLPLSNTLYEGIVRR